MLLTIAALMLAPTYSTDDLQDAVAMVDRLHAAAKSARYEQLRPLFNEPSYAAHLEAMAGPGASLRSIGISPFPAPPGFENFGKYWIVFHRYQGLEAEHDAVFPLVPTGEGLRLGREMPEDLKTAYKVEHIDFDLKLQPENSRASITAVCELKRVGDGPRTAFMRMNDAYTVLAATYNGLPVELIVNKSLGESMLNPKTTQLLQAGGIIYLTNASDGGQLQLKYDASVNLRGLDKTTPDQMLLTSYWYPHIGRGPATSTTRIDGPKEWLLMGNGNLVGEKVVGTRKVVEYKNMLAIPYFHAVGGPYSLAHETEGRGRKFRAWHLNVDKNRAKHDAEMARDSVAFFEDRFGKFPYEGYDVVDTPDYYGIECYSFTLLTPGITSWATSHEVGHTYFGGWVPNSYIHSIWNESLTQYIDSAQFKSNSDQSLNLGYSTRNTKVALEDPLLAHGPHGNVGYYRGAYVMKMLENELGLETMNRCLRELAVSRKGRMTEWSDIDRSFTNSSKRKLDWFFAQWVRGSIFPEVSFVRTFAEKAPREGHETTITLAQTGTAAPFRLRLVVIIETDAGEKKFPVEMIGKEQEFWFPTPGKPRRISIDTFGWTLASGPLPVRIN